MNVTIAERNRLVQENLPLVRFFVRRFHLPPDLRDDALQAGAMGLLRAIEKYEPDHVSGSSLSGYASRWIISYVSRAVNFGRRWSDAVELTEDVATVDAEEHMLLATERQQLQRYIAALPERQMAILTQRLAGEMSSEAIGQSFRPRVTGQWVRKLEAQAYETIRMLARRGAQRRRRALADEGRMSA